MTRGRDENTVCVITETHDVTAARDVLDAVLAADRADIPATTQRRTSTPKTASPDLDARFPNGSNSFALRLSKTSAFYNER